MSPSGSASTRTPSQASFHPVRRPLCDHNTECAILTSLAPRCVGRRFYGCAKWKVDDCGFFLWIDKEPPDQRTVCKKYCGRIRQDYKKHYESLGRDRDATIAKFLKENATQAADIARADAKLEAAESTLEAYKKGALFLSVFVFVVFAYCLLAY